MLPMPTFSAETLLAEILEWIAHETPTYAPETVERMQGLAAERINGLGLSLEVVPGHAGLVGTLICRRPGRLIAPGLLIIGHPDTVHPVGTLAGPLPTRRDGDRCFGPGIYDMKAGIVMILTALERMIEADALDLPVTILINGDEEVGSPVSCKLIQEMSSTHSHVLIPEPAFGKAGEVTTGRHIFHRFTLCTHGQPALSGWTNEEGRSAIRIMAQIVGEMEGRSDFRNGPTYSVGVIDGGRWVNCVPMTCSAQVLCVARNDAAAESIRLTMADLQGTRSDVRMTVEAGPVRPLWKAGPRTHSLYDRARAIADDLGFNLPHGQHGGGSDGNFSGALGLATLDGLGAVGHGARIHEEHILVSSLAPRTRLFFGLIHDLCQVNPSVDHRQTRVRGCEHLPRRRDVLKKKQEISCTRRSSAHDVYAAGIHDRCGYNQPGATGG